MTARKDKPLIASRESENFVDCKKGYHLERHAPS